MTSSISGTTDPQFSIYSPQSRVYHDLHPREIRLVTLLRGQWTDAIQCQLHHAPLDNRPTYKALSYAWGSPRATRSILVNGCQHAVTVNLESALRRIRETESDLVLWIDALCINQSSTSERTEQVRLMHDIFASTEEVIVYLGEPPANSLTPLTEQASASTTIFHYDDRDEDKLEIFRDHCVGKRPSKALKAEIRRNYAFDVFCFLRLLAGKQNMNPLPAFDSNSRQFIDSKYQRNLFEGLRQLLLRRWWNRIWVIQEVVVPKTVTVLYGSTSAPWDMFVDAARWDSRNHSSSAPLSFPREYSTVLAWFSRVILDIDGNRELWRERKHSSLLSLLQRFSDRKASDDRDKVFALLSLAHTSIVPNYSLSVSVIFQNTVLDIIKTTKSLGVLAGDLGRKDRQDLPSWVPDWSAVYNDPDRRRANNLENYNATSGCEVYVDDGRSPFAGLIKGETSGDHIKVLNKALGTSDWVAYLPNGNDVRTKPDVGTCLGAIKRFCTANGRTVGVKLQGDRTNGIIALAGLQVDKIEFTGEVAFSDDVLLPVVCSWALLVDSHFLNTTYVGSTTELGDAFRRTLCADIISAGSDTKGSTTRRINKDDHIVIATWLRLGLESNSFPVNSSLEIRRRTWETLCRDVKYPTSYILPKAVSLNIDAAISTATIRRRFFITKKGYIGLGPANMSPGDYLHILMGAQTPFILRYSRDHEVYAGMYAQPIKQEHFELIGDCYAHGLMDGEAMDEWKRVASNSEHDLILHNLSQRRLEAVQTWERHRTNLSDWKKETDEAIHLPRAGENPTVYLPTGTENPNLFMETLVTALQTGKAGERAHVYTSNLSQWRDHFSSWKEGNGLWRNVDYPEELVNTATVKMFYIQKDIEDARRQIERMDFEIHLWKERDEKIVYLV